MKLIWIGYNHDTGRNLEIWLHFLKKFQLDFSSKIELPQLGLARAEKFQLEPITRKYVHNIIMFTVSMTIWRTYLLQKDIVIEYMKIPSIFCKCRQEDENMRSDRRRHKSCCIKGEHCLKKCFLTILKF